MSLLSDTILSASSTRLHPGGDNHGRKSVRKSKSHAGLLAPLVQLARDPLGALHHAVGSPSSVPDAATPRKDADRTQILYLRLKNVCPRDWAGVATTC
jgi:TAG lipase/steryl ester hydrolase/phospholipase A2/LPA acyltransferase